MIDYQTLRKTVQDAVERRHESMVVSKPKAAQTCSNHVEERFIERSMPERPDGNTNDVSLGAYFTLLACTTCSVFYYLFYAKSIHKVCTLYYTKNSSRGC